MSSSAASEDEVLVEITDLPLPEWMHDMKSMYIENLVTPPIYFRKYNLGSVFFVMRDLAKSELEALRSGFDKLVARARHWVRDRDVSELDESECARLINLAMKELVRGQQPRGARHTAYILEPDDSDDEADSKVRPDKELAYEAAKREKARKRRADLLPSPNGDDGAPPNEDDNHAGSGSDADSDGGSDDTEVEVDEEFESDEDEQEPLQQVEREDEDEDEQDSDDEDEATLEDLAEHLMSATWKTFVATLPKPVTRKSKVGQALLAARADVICEYAREIAKLRLECKKHERAVLALNDAFEESRDWLLGDVGVYPGVFLDNIESLLSRRCPEIWERLKNSAVDSYKSKRHAQQSQLQTVCTATRNLAIHAFLASEIPSTPGAGANELHPLTFGEVWDIAYDSMFSRPSERAGTRTRLHLQRQLAMVCIRYDDDKANNDSSAATDHDVDRLTYEAKVFELLWKTVNNAPRVGNDIDPHHGIRIEADIVLATDLPLLSKYRILSAACRDATSVFDLGLDNADWKIVEDDLRRVYGGRIGSLNARVFFDDQNGMFDYGARQKIWQSLSRHTRMRLHGPVYLHHEIAPAEIWWLAYYDARPDNPIVIEEAQDVLEFVHQTLVVKKELPDDLKNEVENGYWFEFVDPPTDSDYKRETAAAMRTAHKRLVHLLSSVNPSGDDAAGAAAADDDDTYSVMRNEFHGMLPSLPALEAADSSALSTGKSRADFWDQMLNALSRRAPVHKKKVRSNEYYDADDSDTSNESDDEDEDELVFKDAGIMWHFPDQWSAEARDVITAAMKNLLKITLRDEDYLRLCDEKTPSTVTSRVEVRTNADSKVEYGAVRRILQTPSPVLGATSSIVTAASLFPTSVDGIIGQDPNMITNTDDIDADHVYGSAAMIVSPIHCSFEDLIDSTNTRLVALLTNANLSHSQQILDIQSEFVTLAVESAARMICQLQFSMASVNVILDRLRQAAYWADTNASFKRARNRHAGVKLKLDEMGFFMSADAEDPNDPITLRWKIIDELQTLVASTLDAVDPGQPLARNRMLVDLATEIMDYVQDRLIHDDAFLDIAGPSDIPAAVHTKVARFRTRVAAAPTATVAPMSLSDLPALDPPPVVLFPLVASLFDRHKTPAGIATSARAVVPAAARAVADLLLQQAPRRETVGPDSPVAKGWLRCVGPLRTALRDMHGSVLSMPWLYRRAGRINVPGESADIQFEDAAFLAAYPDVLRHVTATTERLATTTYEGVVSPDLYQQFREFARALREGMTPPRFLCTSSTIPYTHCQGDHGATAFDPRCDTAANVDWWRRQCIDKLLRAAADTASATRLYPQQSDYTAPWAVPDIHTYPDRANVHEATFVSVWEHKAVEVAPDLDTDIDVLERGSDQDDSDLEAGDDVDAFGNETEDAARRHWLRTRKVLEDIPLLVRYEFGGARPDTTAIRSVQLRDRRGLARKALVRKVKQEFDEKVSHRHGWRGLEVLEKNRALIPAYIEHVASERYLSTHGVTAFLSASDDAKDEAKVLLGKLYKAQKFSAEDTVKSMNAYVRLKALQTRVQMDVPGTAEVITAQQLQQDDTKTSRARAQPPSWVTTPSEATMFAVTDVATMQRIDEMSAWLEVVQKSTTILHRITAISTTRQDQRTSDLLRAFADKVQEESKQLSDDALFLLCVAYMKSLGDWIDTPSDASKAARDAAQRAFLQGASTRSMKAARYLLELLNRDSPSDDDEDDDKVLQDFVDDAIAAARIGAKAFATGSLPSDDEEDAEVTRAEDEDEEDDETSSADEDDDSDASVRSEDMYEDDEEQVSDEEYEEDEETVEEDEDDDEETEDEDEEV